jgi:hypothetical protein
MAKTIDLNLRILSLGQNQIQAALAAIGKEADASQTKLDRLTVAFQPQNLSRQVKLDLQVSQAQKQYAQAYQTELAAQAPLTTRVGRAVGRVGKVAGGAALVGAGGLAAAVGAAQLANPAVVERLTMAFRDVGAVIGHSVLPIVELFTRGVRLLGDFLASILPSQAEMAKLTKALEPAFQGLREIMTALAPLIADVLSGVLKGVIWLVSELAKGLKWLADRIKDALAYLGIASNKPLLSSVGAAASPASFVSIADLGARAQQAGKKPEEETAANTGMLVKIAEEVARKGFDVPSPAGAGMAEALARFMGGK